MNFILAATGSATASGGLGSSPYSMIFLMIGMFAIMYFVMIRPQKKRQKEEMEMRSAIDVGDEITTIGGICGRVVSVKENHLIIESSSAGSKIQILRGAVQSNDTANARLQAEREAARAEAEKAKEEKKKNKKSKKED
ncbi:MAG: preprotein translocase subunit YajC [Oscillospiraceae bacterium]|nr:preprotein translocase subunit YajC [Oscillospiraceae bacterium]MDD6526779.1 preprotein translocase subunit YajC [Oscillospiraceae bacterium]